jgi:hypothetical protein
MVGTDGTGDLCPSRRLAAGDSSAAIATITYRAFSNPAGHYTDAGHDAVKDEAVCIAVFSDTG